MPGSAYPPITLFYHGVLRGPQLNEDHCLGLFCEQMILLASTRLRDAAAGMIVGLNGDWEDQITAEVALPFAAEVTMFPEGKSELTTLGLLYRWVRSRPEGWICYFHMKGAQYPHNHTWDNWRHCMERAVIRNWRVCAESLLHGIDTCGAHWMTTDRFPMVLPGQRYWGGNFWWATHDYLRGLPAPPHDCAELRYEAETWIGRSRTKPRVRDFAPHFPMSCPPS